MNRREFLTAAAASSALLGLTSEVMGEANHLATDPLRPQFHLLPAKNWMNDPNGPIYWNGEYHMFFQYNPLGPTWGNMSWDHAMSSDMLHWTHLPVAMTPTAGSPDAFGCFSGTAIASGSRAYFIYTGTVLSTPEAATLRDGHNDILETQCLAWSDDPRLLTWHKDSTPILAKPPSAMHVTGFRDPSLWRQGDWYYMVIGSGETNVGGCVLLYRSPAPGDFKHWEYLHPLASGTWNGTKTVNPCDDGEMWECPDFFALDGGHVLIYSTLGKVYWRSGELDATTMKFTHKKTGVLDFDAFYAPKTQLDAQGRRILWGWIPERRSDAAMLAAGWSGMMSLPRMLNLDHDGTLRIRSLPQLTALRAGPLKAIQNAVLLPNATGEALIRGTGASPLQVIVEIASGPSELLRITYSPEKRTLVAGDDVLEMQGGDLPSVHIFVDGSVLEVVLGERIGCTKRFYYTQATAPDIRVRAQGEGATMQAWSVTPISRNRLSTPARS